MVLVEEESRSLNLRSKNSDSDDDSSKPNYFVPTKNEIVTEAGLVPEHVRVAIAVPMNYLVQVYRERQTSQWRRPQLNPCQQTLVQYSYPGRRDLENKIKEVVVPLLTKEIAVEQLSRMRSSRFRSLKL